MAERFFVETAIASTQVVLTGDEAHHLARVMRASVGDLLWLFDGSGIDYQARIVSLRKQAVELEIVHKQPGRVGHQQLSLAVALPKGDRQHWLVEKLTELGVGKLIPLQTERSVASAAQAKERLKRWSIEACKQCQRSDLLEIAPPTSLSELIAQTDEQTQKFVAHPGGEPLTTIRPQTSSLLAIGPEGGFSDDEVALLQTAQFAQVSLGSLILRVETAAIAAAVWLGAER